MRAVSKEDHHGERVTKQKLSNACEHEEHATEKDVDCSSRDAETARALPAHYKYGQLPESTT